MENPTALQWMPAMRLSTWSRLPLLSCIIAMAACGGSSTPVDPTPRPSGTPQPEATPATVFQGTVAGARQSGTLEATLQSAVALSARSNVSSRAQVEASGVLVLLAGGGTVGLTGTYDDSTGRVTLSGSGFTFDGGVIEGGAELSGGYTDPSGADGTFSTLNASAAAVSSHCGGYGGTASGTWNMVLGNGPVAGTFSGSPGGLLRGTQQGTSVSGDWWSVGSSDAGTFRGTLQGARLSGTWQASTSSDSGTFSGSSPCQ